MRTKKVPYGCKESIFWVQRMYLMCAKKVPYVYKKCTFGYKGSTFGYKEGTFGYRKIMQLIQVILKQVLEVLVQGELPWGNKFSLKVDLPPNPRFSFEASGLSVQSLCDLCHWEFWRCTFKLFLIGLDDRKSTFGYEKLFIAPILCARVHFRTLNRNSWLLLVPISSTGCVC